MDECGICWGSHGCELKRGHSGSHRCGCCECPEGRHDGITAPTLVDDDHVICVAQAPYYGKATRFYGGGIGADKNG